MGKENKNKKQQAVTNLRSMDEIFAPFRKHTEQISETEIDQLVKKARREVKAEQNKQTRKP